MTFDSLILDQDDAGAVDASIDEIDASRLPEDGNVTVGTSILAGQVKGRVVVDFNA